MESKASSSELSIKEKQATPIDLVDQSPSNLSSEKWRITKEKLATILENSKEEDDLNDYNSEAIQEMNNINIKETDEEGQVDGIVVSEKESDSDVEVDNTGTDLWLIADGERAKDDIVVGCDPNLD
ncbi:OLC1v1005476C1, partial [Oldenlandia corymbosa var. corymbosa]